ncbi:hypothetical protein [Teredinibacter sp. KSP-S5-2]|uniref:hypothetical protein n=1 Tax=Teredinibacter sp. KSP-S5-2 TaxID=3034506 RepID=UPI002934DBCE|nr:hypothetical protein [Teredinibacter sp. KSP-S5-2]WNO10569.1 hypothetical protein P5V12_05220 [Teredinibacter sp. KSP-S5-2]
MQGFKEIRTEFNKVMSIIKKQRALVEACNVSTSAASQWVKQGWVPPSNVIFVYQLVKGKKTIDGEEISLEKLLYEGTMGKRLKNNRDSN